MCWIHEWKSFGHPSYRSRMLKVFETTAGNRQRLPPRMISSERNNCLCVSLPMPSSFSKTRLCRGSNTLALTTGTKIGNGYLTPAILGDHMWAKRLHHPYHFGGPQCPERGKK